MSTEVLNSLQGVYEFQRTRLSYRFMCVSIISSMKYNLIFQLIFTFIY